MKQIAKKPDPMLYLRGTDNRNINIAVVLAVSRMDWHLAVKWLDWWAAMLQGQPNPFPITALFSPALTLAQVERLGDCRLPNMRLVEAANVKEMGYFGSANQMMKAALDDCEKNFPGRAMLWCEADTVPMRSTWVAEILEEYRWCGRAFMGDVVQCAVNHMTGVAVYHPDWRYLAPSLAALPGPDMTWGWDSQCAYETLAQAYKAKTIQQIWRPEKIDIDFLEEEIRDCTALFHQDKSGALIDLLAEKNSVKLPPMEQQLCESTYSQGSPHPASREVSELPKMEILIVTFKRDLEFLRYCMRSIAMFTSGFMGVTVVVPNTEKNLYDWMPKGAKLRTFEEQPGKGMVGHLAMKCHADELCPNADFVLHMDADNMFFAGVTPDDFLMGYRPMLVRERYAECGARNENRLVWQDRVQKAIGIKPEWETMVRHPQVYQRDVYRKTRELVTAHTGQQFDDYVLAQQNTFPQGFAEFPTLGAVALKYFEHKYWPIDYDRDADAAECGVDPAQSWQYLYRPGRDKLVEFYSHAGFAQYRKQAEDIMHGRLPKYFIK